MIIHVMGLICVFLTSTTEPYDPVPKVISVGVTPFKMYCPSGRLRRSYNSVDFFVSPLMTSKSTIVHGESQSGIHLAKNRVQLTSYDF